VELQRETISETGQDSTAETMRNNRWEKWARIVLKPEKKKKNSPNPKAHLSELQY